MKKGTSSQVFIYIFLVIVMALILFFGFKQIAGLSKLSDESNYVVFKNDFSDAVNNLYYKNKGSTNVFSSTSRNKPLGLPKGINEVCFNEGEVSLVPENYGKFEVENLDGNLCIKSLRDALNFKLENMGTFVEISEV